MSELTNDNYPAYGVLEFIEQDDRFAMLPFWDEPEEVTVSTSLNIVSKDQ